MHREDYEIVVVDDGSTDYTWNILESFGDWLTPIRLDSNKGLSYARNCGIKRATGQFVVMVDADDYVHEDFLNVLNLYLVHNREMNAVACDYYTVNDQEEILERKSFPSDPIACGIMFRKDPLVQLGLYKESLRRHEEKELLGRFLRCYNMYYVRLPLYKYRQRPRSLSRP
jgi:cellulose synthase/poly-beta-1,6-N-acetylglucosamine synthase-like glycosyltransferase